MQQPILALCKAVHFLPIFFNLLSFLLKNAPIQSSAAAADPGPVQDQHFLVKDRPLTSLEKQQHGHIEESHVKDTQTAEGAEPFKPALPRCFSVMPTHYKQDGRTKAQLDSTKLLQCGREKEAPKSHKHCSKTD